MSRTSVLFVCIHNSARSQMAEAFLKHFGKDQFEVQSAGFEPGTLNPDVVKVMGELGIDISGNKTQSVGEIAARKKAFDYVITVCDEASAQRCPVFAGGGKRLHWGFEDPSGLSGEEEDRLARIRQIRKQIYQNVQEFIQSF